MLDGWPPILIPWQWPPAEHADLWTTWPPARVLQAPPLPSSAVAYWHSELAITPAVWIDQIGARALPGVGPPVVGTDAGFFNGRVVGQTAIAGARCWVNTALAAFLLAGSRPWLFTIGRFRTATVGNAVMCGIGTGAGAHYNLQTVNSGGSKIASVVDNGATALVGPVTDTLPHRFKQWSDGVRTYLAVDNDLFSTPYVGALPANSVAAAIGRHPPGGFSSDSNVASYLLCASKPSFNEETALDLWAKLYWGTP